MTFRDIIDLWPSKQALADDLAVPVNTVYGWYGRDRVPAEHWKHMIASAIDRDIRPPWEYHGVMQSPAELGVFLIEAAATA